jgi:hypothetical protein
MAKAKPQLAEPVYSLAKASKEQMEVAPFATPCPGLFQYPWGRKFEVACDDLEGECRALFRIGGDEDYVHCPECGKAWGSIDRTDLLGRKMGRPSVGYWMCVSPDCGASGSSTGGGRDHSSIGSKRHGVRWWTGSEWSSHPPVPSGPPAPPPVEAGSISFGPVYNNDGTPSSVTRTFASEFPGGLEKLERMEKEIGWVAKVFVGRGLGVTVKTVSEKLDVLPVSRIRELMSEMMHRELIRQSVVVSKPPCYLLTEKGKNSPYAKDTAKA